MAKTLTEQITSALTQELEDGKYPMGSRFPSETMLSDRFHVNKWTVNKAVTQLVEAGMLQRKGRGGGTVVMQTRRFPLGTIGYVAPLDRYPVQILQGLQAAALHRGYFTVVLSPVPEEREHYLRLLSANSVQGLILVHSGTPKIPSGIHCIYVDHDFPKEDKSHHTVNCDNHAAGVAMMDLILRRGHRDIALFLSEPFPYSPSLPYQVRVMGFHEQMRTAGIADCLERTYTGAQRSLQDACYCLKRMLAEHPDLTLIACDSDNSAELMWQAAQELGVDIPGRITLTGFGNISHLPFATADPCPQLLGEHACNHLIDMIEKRYRGSSPLHERHSVSLVKTEFIPKVVHS
ncbi:MAG: GntR family transcriptional regulator [Victivallales bacterium]|nr:GntR family transcriptional regulator [Victivallales bacterium]